MVNVDAYDTDECEKQLDRICSQVPVDTTVVT